MNNRNVEIKARLSDVEHAISKAKYLSNSDNAIIITQHDTFFKVSEGRLKLRKFEDGTAELLYYNRPDTLGPKLCNYNKIKLSALNAEVFVNFLSEALGILGIVKKTRQLFLVGQTRVHIDEVDSLGSFIELEVVLREDQDVETGQEIASNLMQELSIAKDNLIAEAYIDLLKKANTPV